MSLTEAARRTSPQCATVLAHLQRKGSLSPVEAQVVYRIRALPRRIKDLKERGYAIQSEQRKDATGQRYVRYRLDTPATA